VEIYKLLTDTIGIVYLPKLRLGKQRFFFGSGSSAVPENILIAD
jgi:hypothetical protein